jgi:hypothetical protein
VLRTDVDIDAVAAREAKRAIKATGGGLVVFETATEFARRTESPIEAIFAVWFIAAREHLLVQGNARFQLALRPQTWVACENGERYRLDFSLAPQDPWLAAALTRRFIALRVGVELDGHEFHERTKAQVAARDRRDRDLAALKWRVLHFSGSELRTNPMLAVVEVLEAGAAALDDAKAALLHA